MKTRNALLIFSLFVICTILSSCGFLGAGGIGNKNDGTSGSSPVYSVNIYIEANSNTHSYKTSDFLDTTKGIFRVPKVEPQKEGFTFEGWYLDNDLTKPLTAGTKPEGKIINIYPKFEPAVIDIKIIDTINGNDIIKVNYGECISMLPPTVDGYIFDGWYTDENGKNAFDLETIIKSETQIYVRWNYAEYSISYELNGGEFVEEEQISKFTMKNSVILPNAKKEGYSFIGWCEKENLSDNCVTTIEEGEFGNKVFYAKYLNHNAEMLARAGLSEANLNNTCFNVFTDSSAHTVQLLNYFNFSENSTIIVKNDESEVVENGEVELSANLGTGGTINHNFTIYVTSESGTNMKEYSVTIKQYDESTVSVIYKVDGEIVSNGIVAKGSNITDIYECQEQKVGYDFGFWSINGIDEYNFDSTLTTNIILQAVFSPIEYTISYSLGTTKNRLENPSTYTIESDFELQKAIVPEGYFFVGWFLDNSEEEITKFTGLIGDKVLYAKYSLDAYWSFIKEADKYLVSQAQYPYLLDYLMFYNESSAEIIVTDLVYESMTEQELGNFYTTSAKEIDTSCQIGISYINNSVTVTFSNYIYPIKKSSNGTYEQIDFIKFGKDGSREETFDDFAINHIVQTMSVTTSEQLYFALEKGFRPSPTKGSVAEIIYAEMKNILNGIIGLDMTEKEKALAISEYLVDSIAYDNAVLAMFEGNGENLMDYRSFYLEGAILDKVAVCDGISKAFTSLCAIEGIKSLQVNGKHNNVNHAWNKVLLDLNGDGIKEWSVVDCTSANTLLKLDSEGVENGVEIMNYSFIFTTDDMILNKQNYQYAEKWIGLYNAVTDYDIYKNTLLNIRGTADYYAESEEEMTEIFTKYKTIFDELTEEDSTFTMSFCVPENLLINNSNKFTVEVSNAMHSAGFTTSEINNNMKKVILVALSDTDVIFLFYIEKTE